ASILINHLLNSRIVPSSPKSQQIRLRMSAAAMQNPVTPVRSVSLFSHGPSRVKRAPVIQRELGNWNGAVRQKISKEFTFKTLVTSYSYFKRTPEESPKAITALPARSITH